jgi:hypothetical protein
LALEVARADRQLLNCRFGEKVWSDIALKMPGSVSPDPPAARRNRSRLVRSATILAWASMASGLDFHGFLTGSNWPRSCSATSSPYRFDSLSNARAITGNWARNLSSATGSPCAAIRVVLKSSWPYLAAAVKVAAVRAGSEDCWTT